MNMSLIDWSGLVPCTKAILEMNGWREDNANLGAERVVSERAKTLGVVRNPFATAALSSLLELRVGSLENGVEQWARSVEFPAEMPARTLRGTATFWERNSAALFPIGDVLLLGTLAISSSGKAVLVCDSNEIVVYRGLPTALNALLLGLENPVSGRTHPDSPTHIDGNTMNPRLLHGGVVALLWQSGWIPNRRRIKDVDQLIRQWGLPHSASEFSVAHDVLAQLGELTIGSHGPGIDRDSRGLRCAFDPTDPCYSLLRQWSIAEKLPIAQTTDGRLVLCDRDGKISSAMIVASSRSAGVMLTKVEEYHNIEDALNVILLGLNRENRVVYFR